MIFNIEEQRRIENAVHESKAKTPRVMKELIEVLKTKTDERVSQLKVTPELSKFRHLQGTILVLEDLLKLFEN